MYRQHVLLDCIDRPGVVRDLYEVAVAALTGEKKIFGWVPRDSPDSIVHRTRQAMQLFVGMLRRLRDITDANAASFRPGVHRPAAGRRDQPDPAQDPGRPAGGDGRGAGQRGRRHPATAAAVRGAGHDNPIECEGTYPLPEAQLDRFIARVSLGYLDADGEAEMVRRRLARGSAAPTPPQVTDAARLLAMRESLEAVQLHPDLLAYVVSLIAATRSHPQVAVGASPRGALAVVQLARGHAVPNGRWLTGQATRRAHGSGTYRRGARSWPATGPLAGALAAGPAVAEPGHRGAARAGRRDPDRPRRAGTAGRAGARGSRADAAPRPAGRAGR